VTPRMILLFLLAATPAQESDSKVSVATTDGTFLIGTINLKSVTLETSVGSSPLLMKNIRRIRFEGTKVVIEGRDGSQLKGTLALDSAVVDGVLGRLTIKRADLVAIDVPEPDGLKRAVLAAAKFNVVAVTKDGNTVVGDVESLKLKFRSSLGSFELAMPPADSVTVLKDHDEIGLSDGSRLVGHLDLDEIRVKGKLGDFTIKKDQLTRLTLREIPSSAPGVKPLDIRPLAWKAIPQNLGPFVVSPDGAKVYAIDPAGRKLTAWSLPELESCGEVAVKGSEKSLAFSPDGRNLVAVGGYDVSTYSVEKLERVSGFEVENSLQHIASLTSDDFLVADGLSAYFLSLSKRGISKRFESGTPRSPLAVSADRRRVYSERGCFVFPEDRNLQGVRWSDWLGGASGRPSMSPDGKFLLFSPSTQLLRLGRGAHSPMAHLQILEEHTSSCFSPDSKRLFLFTASGSMKSLETEDFKPIRSELTGVVARQAECDPSGKWIVVAGKAFPGSELAPKVESEPVYGLYCLPVPK
jgi:WD40 repeat protein